MTRQFEDDMQPDGIPYTVLANNLTDHNTFIQGLRNAGFEIHDEDVSIVPPYPDTALVTFASGVHARQAMLALHLRDFKGIEGKKMHLMKAPSQRVGIWDNRSPCAPLPTYQIILQAMVEAYHAKAVAPRRAEKAAARLPTGLRKLEKRMRREEEARLRKQEKEAKRVKKAANVKMKREAKLAKDARRALHFKGMEEAKFTAQQDEDPSMGLEEVKEAEAEWHGDLSNGLEGMEDIEAVAGEEPEVSAWLEAMRQQHKDREDLGAALQG